MKKMKLLTAILFCLGVAGMASATEVIQIDLNGYGNTVAYNGLAPTDIGTTTWRAYYGGSNPEGWGKAMGSPRTASLANYDEPNQPSTYEAQVWIGDNNATVPHGWIMGTGTGLMDDGFKKSGGPADPNPSVVLWGKDAYAGKYDLYLLGNNGAHFKVTNPAHNYGTQTVAGGVAEFDDVNIGAYDANLTVTYDSNFYGIQLVKKLNGEVKEAIAIHDPTCGNENDWVEVDAPEYDVAYETNLRGPNEPMHFGPDFEIGGAVVAYLDSGEYMKYDIYVAPADAGYYDIDALVNTFEGKVNNLQIYVDDVLYGSMYDVNDTSASASLDDYFWISLGDTSWPGGFQASGNLFAGYHTLEWRVPTQQYFNIQKLRLLCVGPIDMSDCNDVYRYNLNDAMDFNHDCHVDFKDLALIANNWATCYSPDPNDCL